MLHLLMIGWKHACDTQWLWSLAIVPVKTFPFSQTSNNCHKFNPGIILISIRCNMWYVELVWCELGGFQTDRICLLFIVQTYKAHQSFWEPVRWRLSTWPSVSKSLGKPLSSCRAPIQDGLVFSPKIRLLWVWIPPRTKLRGVSDFTKYNVIFQPHKLLYYSAVLKQCTPHEK